MSYQEKRTATTIFTGLLILVAYCLYVFNPARLSAPSAGDLQWWAVTMLEFIAAGVVATIVVQIVFHVLLSVSLAVQAKMEDQTRDDKAIETSISRSIEREIVEDERDRLIELKSMRIGFIVAGAGFVAALLALAFDLSPVIMLNILFFSFSAGSVIEGFGQIYYYRRGL
jgi:hypothetical protein